MVRSPCAARRKSRRWLPVPSRSCSCPLPAPLIGASRSELPTQPTPAEAASAGRIECRRQAHRRGPVRRAHRHARGRERESPHRPHPPRHVRGPRGARRARRRRQRERHAHARSAAPTSTPPGTTRPAATPTPASSSTRTTGSTPRATPPTRVPIWPRSPARPTTRCRSGSRSRRPRRASTSTRSPACPPGCGSSRARGPSCRPGPRSPGSGSRSPPTPNGSPGTMGDGETVTCDGPGTPYDPAVADDAQSTECSHVYQDTSVGEPDGRYPASVTVDWSVDWDVLDRRHRHVGRRVPHDDLRPHGHRAPGGGDLQAVARGRLLRSRPWPCPRSTSAPSG